MHTNCRDPVGMPDTRTMQVARLHAAHANTLERSVTRRVTAEPETVEDACSFAWAELLSHASVDLGPPPWRALAWLMRTAVREAWRLEAKQAREEQLRHEAAEQIRTAHERSAGTEEVAQLRARLALVSEIPERPRRFLIRLALGHSYREIATAEGASVTTTRKQIARAKRVLRDLDRDNHQQAA